MFAIKKFKPDQAPDKALSAGISQSATREISLCVEYHHENVVRLQVHVQYIHFPDNSTILSGSNAWAAR